MSCTRRSMVMTKLTKLYYNFATCAFREAFGKWGFAFGSFREIWSFVAKLCQKQAKSQFYHNCNHILRKQKGILRKQNSHSRHLPKGWVRRIFALFLLYINTNRTFQVISRKHSIYFLSAREKNINCHIGFANIKTIHA